MENASILLSKILNTPPFQLPPVVHTNGCYTLDTMYLSKSYHKVGLNLEEVLEGYWHFITQTNYQQTSNKDVLLDLPVPAGTAIYPHRN